jgi:hypothetical protein
MNRNEQIERMTGEALDSLDGSSRAIPKPFLMTRIRARMEKQKSNGWEVAGRFIAKPSVAIVGFCVVIAVNVFVMVSNNSNSTTGYATAGTEQNGNQDEYASNVASLYDIENNNTNNTEP